MTITPRDIVRFIGYTLAAPFVLAGMLLIFVVASPFLLFDWVWESRWFNRSIFNTNWFKKERGI